MAGALRIVSNAELTNQENTTIKNEMDAKKIAESSNSAESNLAAYIRQQFYYYRWHRQKFGLEDRYLKNLQTYNGEYGARKLADIRAFGGSDVFARISTVKCRGATSILRDIYLGAEQPWRLDPTPVPSLPDSIEDSITKLIGAEMQSLAQMGEPIDPEAIKQRGDQLQGAAERAALKKAKEEAIEATTKVEDILVEGGFYDAMRGFLIDLPVFRIAVIKGPVMKMKTRLKWVGKDGNKKPKVVREPIMTWSRVSPFDLYMDPGASNAAEANKVERIRLFRKDLEECRGLPGYNTAGIDAVLSDYEHGLSDWLDDAESERAVEEKREDPYLNRSDMIDTLEFHGAIKGEWLLEYGFEKDQIEDPIKDYHVVAWLIGNYVVKVQINPDPNQRDPYRVHSFEEVPGSAYGNSLIEIIADIQDVANSSLRSLVNNMAIASGPQVVVNETRLSPTTNPDSLVPWKRWRVTDDPLNMNPRNQAEKPVDFFQPDSNANELMGIYMKMTEIADEISAIPRYITGDNKVGGAASTASGLSMLMNNASKVLQNVAAGIDMNIIKPTLEQTYNLIMLTDDTGMLRGDEQIQVRGVNVAIAKEQDRLRRLEFLQMTANPIDHNIVGDEGRAAVLRSIAGDLALPHEEVVPSREQMQAVVDNAQQMGDLQAAAQAQGGQSPMPGRSGAGNTGEEFYGNGQAAQGAN